MDLMEIILLIAGGIIFVLSFFIPDKKGQDAGMTKESAEEEIKKMVEKEIEAIRSHIDDVVEEAVTYSMEKTERSLERLSNEKIMAVSEYSDTVLAEIHKSHEEAMFLYDMLNSKHINLKDTVSEVNRTVREAEETVSGIKKALPEAMQGMGQEKSIEPSRVADLTGDALSTDSEEKDIERVAAEFRPMNLTEGENIVSGRVSFIQETDEQGRSNNDKILELYRQGKSTVAIAKELGLGVGEVKLVIGLYKNQ